MIVLHRTSYSHGGSDGARLSAYAECDISAENGLIAWSLFVYLVT